MSDLTPAEAETVAVIAELLQSRGHGIEILGAILPPWKVSNGAGDWCRGRIADVRTWGNPSPAWRLWECGDWHAGDREDCDRELRRLGYVLLEGP